MTDATAQLDGKTVIIDFGENTNVAAAAALRAESAAIAAQAAAGLDEYANTAAGLAGTTEGEFFWVDNAAGIGIVYRHDAGPVATEIRRFIIDPEGTSAASLIGADDGASGTLWTKLQGFINYLMSSAGSAIVRFIHSGTGAVARTAESKMRDFVSVMDFGAIGDGITDDTAEIQACITAHRQVYFPPGTYKITDRLLVATANTVLWLGPNVTISTDAWTYPGSQTPFGNSIHITAANCSVIGSGPSSVIQNTGASDANGIGFLHIGGGYVANLTLDGDKANVTAITDDTFQSGISVINTTAGSVPDTNSDTVIENVTLKNWCQYGINIYGDLTKNIRISNCHIYDNGKTADANSVGAGIVLTRANKRITVTGCSIHGNKNKGIFQSSAGENAGEMVFSNNLIYSNGSHGISCTEESGFGSISGAGTDGVTITGNTIYANTGHGILLGTFDSVGFLKNVTVTGNVVNGNGSYGIVVFTNNHATDRTSNVVINDNVLTGNTQYGIGIAANNTSITASDNICLSNTAGQIQNLGSGGTSVYGNIVSTTVPTHREGTFTPAIAGITTAGVGTYSAQSGSYTLNGNRVTFDILLDWSAHTGTGDMKITGLPFTAATEEPQCIAWASANGLTITGQVYVFVNSATTEAAISAMNNGATSAVAMDTSAVLRVSGTYRI